MNRQRLNELADFLDQLTPEVFDFTTVVRGGIRDHTVKSLLSEGVKTGHYCGAVACAIGYAPLAHPDIPGLGHRDGYVTMDDDQCHFVDFGAALYGISRADSFNLFSNLDTDWNEEDYDLHNTCPETATPQQVATSIRNFIKWKEGQQ